MAEHQLQVDRREGRVRLFVDGQFQGFLGGKAELTPKLLDSFVASYVRKARDEGHTVIVEETPAAAA